MSRACVGVPYDHTRVLTEEERAWLSARAGRARRKRIVFGIGTAFVPILIFLPMVLALAQSVAALLMIPSLWTCVFLPLKWIDARKRARFALASARGEEVEVYQGVPDVGALAERSLSVLLDAGFKVEEETSQRLDRIVASGEVIALNGHRLDPPIWADVTDVAPPTLPDQAFPARVPDFAFEAPSLDRRVLSDAERAELRRFVPERESFRQRGCLFGLCVYLLAGTFGGVNASGVAALLAVFRVLLIGYLLWVVFLAFRERSRIRRDLAEGAVLLVDHKGVRLEVLPHLGMVWTADGHPSPWRHAMQAKPRPPR